MASRTTLRGRSFTGEALSQIAFPLGGIGTGTISLGGRGNLRDFEIYDHPQKGHIPPFAFFALWAMPVAAKGQTFCRVLERRIGPPYTSAHGLPQTQLSGLPRFEKARFTGAYPFAWLELEDEGLPLQVQLEAFNPLIPHNVPDSSIPGAVFNWVVRNPTDEPYQVSIAASLSNLVPSKDEKGRYTAKGATNSYRHEGALRGLLFHNSEAAAGDPRSGELALVTTWDAVDVQTRWYRGKWWDKCHLFWDDFRDDGRLRHVLDEEPAPDGSPDVGTLLLQATVPAGGEVVLPFYLTWYFPYMRNPWPASRQREDEPLRKYVGVQFSGAWEVAEYLSQGSARLRSGTLHWLDALWSSSLPAEVVDAATSQVSTLRTQVCFRLEDGTFYGWEGCSDQSGCCSGSCTHVWNYEQALAFLFPELERSMRRVEFLGNTRESGHMGFRTRIPPGESISDFKPCADGQMGAVIQAYRDWSLSGDDDFLKEIWPKVKQALEYAWTMTPKEMQPYDSLWDPDKDGVMEGEQHNTYDIEFFGPNPMTTVMYLSALRAAEEMARHLGEVDKAEEYRRVYESGRQRVESELWNGEYFFQKVQVIPEVKVPDHLRTPKLGCGETCPCKASPGGRGEALEGGELPKYQYGAGCLSDQLLGQLSAHIAGLGYVLSSDKVQKALESVFRYNFRGTLEDFHNVQRVYALNDEAGLLLCSWPRGERPALPFVYSDEVWTGIEYHVAAHLIYEGLVKEGLEVVRAVRRRYAGWNRNPWDELECGHHYVRAMASWGVIMALSGFTCHVPSGLVRFAPKIKTGDSFRTFWSTGTAWGVYAQSKDGEGSLSGFELQVAHGTLDLKELAIADLPAGCDVLIEVSGQARRVKVAQGTLLFSPLVCLSAGDSLRGQVSSK